MIALGLNYEPINSLLPAVSVFLIASLNRATILGKVSSDGVEEPITGRVTAKNILPRDQRSLPSCYCEKIVICLRAEPISRVPRNEISSVACSCRTPTVESHNHKCLAA